LAPSQDVWCVGWQNGGAQYRFLLGGKTNLFKIFFLFCCSFIFLFPLHVITQPLGKLQCLRPPKHDSDLCMSRVQRNILTEPRPRAGISPVPLSCCGSPHLVHTKATTTFSDAADTALAKAVAANKASGLCSPG